MTEFNADKFLYDLATARVMADDDREEAYEQAPRNVTNPMHPKIKPHTMVLNAFDLVEQYVRNQPHLNGFDLGTDHPYHTTEESPS